MSAATDALIAQASCIDRCIPKGMQLPVALSLFAQIYNVSTNTDSLIAGAVCIDQCIPKQMQMAALISVMAKAAGVSTDTNSLIDGAKCIDRCIPAGMDLAVLISLAQQILAGGGSGPCPQDMQVSWTPTNLKLGQLMGFVSFDSTPALPGITSLTFNQTTSNEAIDIENSTDLLTISAPNLATFTGGGYFGCVSCSSITSISLPLLVNPDPNSANFVINGNPSLTVINFSSLVPYNGQTIRCNNNALLAATVNQILARCVANAAYVSGTVDLSDGTNAAPTGQGIADKATLIGRGVTVNTN